ncbi:MAG: hypothetical protein AD073_000299 [Mycoplasmataceae bacterium]|nr:MAG: hypothetical protein AD073_000299 [Mycoplasmataceae bacterium]
MKKNKEIIIKINNREFKVGNKKFSFKEGIEATKKNKFIQNVVKRLELR